MITEIMLLLIVLGSAITFIAWSNARKRKQDVIDRREVEDSTGKLKQELERTANEIIGRMENHVAHLEKVLDESERNRTQLEGRVAELKKVLKRTEGQSGELRDLLARLEDAGAEVDKMQRKMDTVERKLNLAMTTPLPMQPSIQQPVQIPPMTPRQSDDVDDDNSRADSKRADSARAARDDNSAAGSSNEPARLNHDTAARSPDATRQRTAESRSAES